jgi:putative transcriptional regulator
LFIVNEKKSLILTRFDSIIIYINIQNAIRRLNMNTTPKRELLLKERKKRQLTQQQAADFIGIHISTYANIEIGRRNPSFKVALKIADFYGINIKKI